MSTAGSKFSAARLFTLLVFAGLFPVSSAARAAPIPHVISPQAQPVPTLVADDVSWQGFSKYWRNWVHGTDRVVVVVAIIAAAALFIITRGKWLK